MKQQQHRTIVFLLTCMTSLLVVIASASVIATEVYKWTDANGIVNYADRPPDGQKAQTINVRDTHLPGNTQPDAARDAVVMDNADGQETSPPQSAADARREKIAKDRKERRVSRAEMDRKCAIHRQRLATMEPSTRVMYRAENGEVVRMDDDVRLAQVEESKAFIAENCD